MKAEAASVFMVTIHNSRVYICLCVCVRKEGSRTNRIRRRHKSEKEKKRRLNRRRGNAQFFFFFELALQTLMCWLCSSMTLSVARQEVPMHFPLFFFTCFSHWALLNCLCAQFLPFCCLPLMHGSAFVELTRESHRSTKRVCVCSSPYSLSALKVDNTYASSPPFFFLLSYFFF